MIAVTGATGTIGSHLLPSLAERGVEVRALSRDPPRTAGREGAGVTWAAANLADRDGLAATLRGAERLFLLTGNAEDMVRLEKNAVQAAERAGVERVVKLSALGASDHSKSVIGLWHYNVERALKDAGLGWTILRPHHFAQNLLLPEVFDREGGRVFSASGEGRIPFIDARDIAEVAAVVLTRERWEGETLTLTGPEAISYPGATGILSATLGRPLTYVDETPDEAWARLRGAGLPPWLVGARLALAAYQRAGGPTERVTDTVERVTGRPARTLSEFAEDHADDLRSRPAGSEG